VSKLNWFIQERKEPSKEEYCSVFLKKRICQERKNIAEYFSRKGKSWMVKILQNMLINKGKICDVENILHN